MKEALSHSDFTYIKINLDKYNVRSVNSYALLDKPEFYPNLFELYVSCEDDLNM